MKYPDFELNGENPMIAIVSDKSTGEIIDCERLVYSWRYDEIFTRHDLTKVEVVIKRPRHTAQPIVEEPTRIELAPTAPPSAPSANEDDDIPF